ncbi:uncharacterized protein LOC112088840 [Eutrema salsugineum]|uniref:uncharacterized protein LOC112088840 n=1 Tax=Eutrema salsugineum TaxID=72664 RepID=UPI000CED1FE7|nr:uncharacterized protein LOC112088840 [Eutrema salsugineum]
MDNANGTCGSSYKLLPSYLQHVVIANPGTIISLETEIEEGVGQRFKYLFYAVGACVLGFKYMRKVVVVDGTHLKGNYGGYLLTASGQDGNYQIYPLAFAIVDGENDKAWTWFFENLVKIVPDGGDVVFVSDRHNSIYAALSKTYPKSRHGICVVHLQRNVQSIFKKKHLGYLISKAARAFNVSEFNAHFNEIVEIDRSCAEYLAGVGFEQWSRAHFTGVRYNVMTSNIAESLNATLAEARGYLIIPLLEHIRLTLVRWFKNRRALANRYGVIRINESEFEVTDKRGISYRVDLCKKTCTCCEYQMLSIPCSHAVAAAVRSNTNVEKLVGEELTTAFWRMAYAESIFPVAYYQSPTENGDVIGQFSLMPPATRRPPRRPRKQRIYSRGEINEATYDMWSLWWPGAQPSDL